MVDAIRAALRLLPVSKSSPGGTCVACSRASLLWRHTTADQSVLSTLSGQQHHAAAREGQHNSASGLGRFARAVLTYVGVSLSVVTANQLAGGPVKVHAKEIGTSRRKDSFMAAEDARASWCHAVAKQYSAQEVLKSEASIQRTSFNALPTAEKTVMIKDVDAKEKQGLSLFSKKDWPIGDDLPWQFGPSPHVDYELQDITFEETSLPEPKIAGSQPFPTVHVKNTDYGEATDIQLEWQWVIDQEHASSKGSAVPLAPLEDKYEIAEEASEDIIHDALQEFPKDIQDFQVPESMMKNFKGTLSATSTLSQAGSKDEQLSSFGIGDHQGRIGKLSLELGASKVQHKSGSWRTADSRELAALVSQKTLEHLENCDLPPQSSFTYKGLLASCDLTPSKAIHSDVSQTFDKTLLSSLLHASEPTCLVNRSLPSSPLILGTSDPTPSHKHQPKRSEPLTIPIIKPLSSPRRQSRCFSLDGRDLKWNGDRGKMSSSGGNVGSGGRGSDTLGEALCHSQTRAREAEKAAFQAIEEKQQLLHLFFREASLVLTYKHWVRLLEIENMWLKMHARDQPTLWMQHTYLNPSVAFERLSKNRWKRLGRKLAQKQMHHQFSSLWRVKEEAAKSSNILVGCTIGLAFALGLSLAGAGLMIGWSMGWIFLAF